MRLPLRTDFQRPGFSLIELMVVLALIGIMAAMIIPEMKGTYEDALLRSTARRLVDVFNVASSRAVTVNQLHRVRIDRKTGRYLVERPAHEGEGKSGFVPMADLPGGEGKLDTRISIEIRRGDESGSSKPEQEAPLISEEDSRRPNKGETIAFYPDGTADPGEIILRDREGFRLGLRINPTTARIHMIELERE
jgi:type II secretion system protein H